MPGEYVICIYLPRSGQGDALKRKLVEHLEVLHRGGFLASRQHLVLESPIDGAILELLAWESEASADRAHSDSNVQQIWGELAEIAEMLTLKDLSEASKTFPHFRQVHL